MTCHCDRGFVCEEHPDHPDGHDGCRVEGVRCPNPDCPYWQGDAPLALDADVHFDGGSIPAALPQKTAAMLKAGTPLRWRRARES